MPSVSPSLGGSGPRFDQRDGMGQPATQAYGARPLKRVMQKELQDPPAEKVLLGDIL